MLVRHSHTTGKFSITGLSAEQLIKIHNESSDGRLRAEIQESLFDSVDDEDIHQEFGYGTKHYWRKAGLDV